MTKCKTNNSYIAAIRGVHTVPTLDDAKLEELIKDAGIDADLIDEVSSHLEDMRRRIYSDASLLKRFTSSPLRTLVELDPRIKEMLAERFRDALDGDLNETVCADAPPTGAYNACALEILQRVAVWLGRSSTNRALFSRESDAAVDAVAGRAPIEAIALAKVALHFTHRP